MDNQKLKTITAEEILAARDYIPWREKQDFVSHISDKCFEVLNITSSIQPESIAIPPMYKEDTEKKNRYLLGAFVKMYFGFDYDTAGNDDEWLMDVPSYDYWAGSHVMNQLDRMKHDAALRNKCFDILNDYKDLEKKVNSEIYGMLNAMNDSVSRLTAVMAASNTPENIQESLRQIEELKTKMYEFSQQGKEEVNTGE